MKVKDTLEIDLIHATLRDKMLNFISGTGCYRYAGDWENTQYIKAHYPSWQYNGVDTFENIIFWCERNLGNNYIWNFETIYFKTEKYKVAFLLRWL